MTPDHWHRVRAAPTVFAHAIRMNEQTVAGIDAHVQRADSVIAARAASPTGI